MLFTSYLKKSLRLTLFSGILFSLVALSGCLEDALKPDDDKDDTTKEDPDALSVVSVNPSDDQTNVLINTAIKVEFNEPVADEDVTSTNFKLRKQSSSVSLSTTVTKSGNFITITPASNLSYSTSYSLVIPSGTQSEAGGVLFNSFGSTFTTQSESSSGGGGDSDTQRPTISNYTTGDLDLDQNITITFSENLLSSTVTNSNFVLKHEDGTTVSRSVSLSGNVVTINPSASLKGAYTDYTVTVSANVADLAGNTLGSASDLSFRTTNVELKVVSMVGGTTDVEVGKNLKFTFSAPLDANTIVDNEYRLLNASATIYGTVTVSGNTLTFKPNTSLKEFSTDYALEYSSTLRDVNGNKPSPTDRQVEFTTEFLSNDFYYYIYNYSQTGQLEVNVQDPYTLYYRTEGTTYCNNLWAIDEAETGYYTMGISCGDYTSVSVPTRYLEGGGTGGTAYLSTRPNSTSYYTGQLWKFTPNTSTHFVLTNKHMVNLGYGTTYYLSGDTKGLTYGGGSNQYRWKFVRSTYWR